eukprot:3159711-Amphidinium_carterae.1
MLRSTSSNSDDAKSSSLSHFQNQVVGNKKRIKLTSTLASSSKSDTNRLFELVVAIIGATTYTTKASPKNQNERS